MPRVAFSRGSIRPRLRIRAVDVVSDLGERRRTFSRRTVLVKFPPLGPMRRPSSSKTSSARDPPGYQLAPAAPRRPLCLARLIGTFPGRGVHRCDASRPAHHSPRQRAHRDHSAEVCRLRWENRVHRSAACLLASSRHLASWITLPPWGSSRDAAQISRGAWIP